MWNLMLKLTLSDDGGNFRQATAFEVRMMSVVSIDVQFQPSSHSGILQKAAVYSSILSRSGALRLRRRPLELTRRHKVESLPAIELKTEHRLSSHIRIINDNY